MEGQAILEPEIRNYSDADLSGVLRLWLECFPEVRSMIAFREMIDRKLATQPGPFLVAISAEGSVVGTVVGGMDGLNGWIYLVAVNQAFRRAGLGTRLVRAMEQRLHGVGAAFVCLQVENGRDQIVNFYHSMGYRIQPRISMVKMLQEGRPEIGKENGEGS